MTEKKTIKFEDIDSAINSKILGADNYRVGQLKFFQKLQAVKRNNMKLERVRLVNTFGEDHQRVRQVDDKIVFARKLIENVDVELKNYDDYIEGELKADENLWVVYGSVTWEDGESAAGMTVSLYDQDFLFDDYLGTRVTDERGYYQFLFRREGFRDLFEKAPDIYLKVYDSSGKPVFTLDTPAKFNVGKREELNVIIKETGEK